MDTKLKRNRLTTVLLMLAAGGIMLADVPIMYGTSSSDAQSIVLSIIIAVFYVLFCVFVWFYGATEVIWKLPVEKTWRMFVSLAWLLLYPALCIGWLWLRGIWAIVIIKG